MGLEFDGGDVVGEIDEYARPFVVRPRQTQRVGHAEGLLFHHVMNAFSRQPSSHMLRNLPNEAVGDDRDVLDSCTPNGAQGIIDDRSLMDWKQGFLSVLCERRQTATVAACNEDGLDVHVPPIHLLFKAPPVSTGG